MILKTTLRKTCLVCHISSECELLLIYLSFSQFWNSINMRLGMPCKTHTYGKILKLHRKENSFVFFYFYIFVIGYITSRKTKYLLAYVCLCQKGSQRSNYVGPSRIINPLYVFSMIQEVFLILFRKGLLNEQ